MSAKEDNPEYEIQDHPSNESDAESEIVKLKYPKSVFFIICNEFCERFSFYGMRTILTLYLLEKLHFSKDTSTIVFHIFISLVYFFPLIGAILADSVLGKFRTIFYVSIIYAIGQVLLSASATPPLGLPAREFSLLGLLLIAIGTGGIKPCVAAFGGDQFILPQQERFLSMFFSLFYFSINSGSLISTTITPLLRSNVPCFGENQCYSLAFFVPAVLMIASIVIFVVGKPLYIIKAPKGNVVVTVVKCVSRAIFRKFKSSTPKRDHWLDYADDKYDLKLIEDIKASLQVLWLFIPLPLFWALYDQQGSRWTLQATRMDGQIGNFLILPDQMQVVNPLLILAFIPLFETVIYPIFAKIGFINTPLKKLTVGGLLASLSFVISALVELKLEATYPVLPSQGLAQVRFFNTMNCDVNMTIHCERGLIVNGHESMTLSYEHEFILKSLSMWENTNVKATGPIEIKYVADFTACQDFTALKDKVSGVITAKEATATSWPVTPEGISDGYEDDVAKPSKGGPLVRTVVSTDQLKNSTLEFKNSKNVISMNIDGKFQRSNLTSFEPDRYDVFLNKIQVQSNVELKLGGVYTFVGYNKGTKAGGNTIVVTPPNSVHMLWLLPQYIVITMGEVMFSVTGLEFAFTQAPVTMKSLLQASWLLTVALGNMIVVVVAEISFFDRQASEFLLFAGLMVVDIIIFAIMSMFYEYVKPQEDDSVDKDIVLEEDHGTSNPSYKQDEK